MTLTAPNLFGTVQVTDLAPMGSLAREKDLIVEYDDSERQSALEEARLSVQSVDEQLKKAKADLAITQSQDAVTLLKTRYNVRRAELDVQRNPIIAEIDGKKNVLRSARYCSSKPTSRPGRSRPIRSSRCYRNSAIAA
jgi:hypothetical protein